MVFEVTPMSNQDFLRRILKFLSFIVTTYHCKPVFDTSWLDIFSEIYLTYSDGAVPSDYEVRQYRTNFNKVKCSATVTPASGQPFPGPLSIRPNSAIIRVTLFMHKDFSDCLIRKLWDILLLPHV